MKKLIRTLPIVVIGVFLIGSALQAAEPGAGEVSGFGGTVSIRDGGGTHGNFGGTVGANLGRFVHLFGEVSYMSMGKETYTASYGTARATAMAGGRLMNYGGGVQIRMPTGAAKIEPYGLITLGYGQMKGDVDARATAGTSSATYSSSDSTHNAYTGVGGGARVFIGRRWGIKPEFRYQKYYGIHLSSNDPIMDHGRVITATAGVFLQFGGN